MLRFSGEIGQPVQRADGSRLGTLRDLTIDLDDDEPLVGRLVVGTRRHVHALVDWEAVASFEHTLVQLGPIGGVEELHTEDQGGLPLDHGELLLGRDVLDTQVVDIAGSRLARVGDILLTRLPDDRLVVGAVDLGFGSVCRRLGLGWLANRLNEEAVGWESLHLTSARGHQVQLATSKAAIHRLDGRELAVLLSRLSVTEGAAVLGTVHPSRAGVALAESHPELASSLMAALAEDELAPALETLPEDKARHLRSMRLLPRPRRFLRHRRRRTHHVPSAAPQDPRRRTG